MSSLAAQNASISRDRRDLYIPDQHPLYDKPDNGRIRLVVVTDLGENRSVEFAVVDVETTGLDARVDRIIEIAIIIADDGGDVVQRWSSLVQPHRPVDATHIHGLTDEDLTDAPSFHDLIPTIHELITGRVFVAHNVRFDLDFLNAEFERNGFPLDLPREIGVCTMEQSYIYLPEGRHNLVACLERAGIARPVHHRSLGDAECARELLRFYLYAEETRQRYMHVATNRFGDEILPLEWERATRAVGTQAPRPIRTRS